MSLVNSVIVYLGIAAAILALYAFVHAAMQRPDAYTAADKMTKPVWLVILGGASAVTLLLTSGASIMGPVIGACAAGVYLVDVRPKLLEIQGKSR